MGARCSILNNFENACGIGECVDSIVGFSMESASMSDMYLLNMRDGVMFNGKPVRHVVAKVTLTLKSMRKLKSQLPHEDEDFEDVLKSFKGLEYEYLVYSNIIKPLLVYKVCPFFVDVYGVAYNCTYKNVLRIVGNERRKAFKQNMFLLAKASRRTSITKPDKEIDKDLDEKFDPHNQARFNMLFTEYIDPVNTKSFAEFMLPPESERIEHSNQYPLVFTQFHFNLLFQVAVAIYALDLSKTNHNDLHHNNVFVTVHDAPVTYYLQVEDAMYKLETRYVCRLFDYDHALAESLGENPLVQESQEEYRKSVDFMYFIGKLTDRFVQDELEVPKVFGELFSDDLELQNKFIKMMTHSNMFLDEDNDEEFVPKEWFDQFDDMSEVIRRLSRLAGVEMVTQAPPNELWSVSADMFDENGLLKTPSGPDETALIYKIGKLNRQIQEARVEEARLQTRIDAAQ